MPDNELIERLRQTDEKALEQFYVLHWPQALAFARQNSGQEADAQEVYQDAVLLFYEKVLSPDFILTGAAAGFLMQIFRYKWLKHISKNRPEITLAAEHQWLMEAKDDELPEDYEKLKQVIQSLSERCQDLLTAFYYKQWSMEHIALQYAYANTDAAKTAKYKCLQKIKNQFKKN